ncbi:MAG: hypothetical protein NTY75_00910 [Candidatus Shapirobacteria bacterium]|nr:hypothetical protein [Candidatus Shapirobacteria bacterium]
MKGWVERNDASDEILTLLVWAVVAVLGMRLWSEITGKMQIAFGVWHIAHMLWGGLLMLISILILTAFGGKKARNWAMITAGMGWGLFIDEIGKFLTKDNNYWFRPAVIFIYVSFVIIFLVYRWLETRQEKYRKTKPSAWETLIARISRSTYTRIFKKKVVLAGLTVYSAYYAIDKIVDSYRIIFSKNRLMMVEKFNQNYSILTRGDSYLIAMKIVSELAVSMMFIIGIMLFINRKRTLGIKFYKNGLLISILLTSVFRFYFEQFNAVFGLILDMLVYSWLVYYYRERTSK